MNFAQNQRPPAISPPSSITSASSLGVNRTNLARSPKGTTRFCTTTENLAFRPQGLPLCYYNGTCPLTAHGRDLEADRLCDRFFVPLPL